MICIIRKGQYRLIETKNHIKVLYLDDDVYAWPNTEQYGEMLVTSHREHKTDAILSSGRYFLYDVDDEKEFNDNFHLELEVGADKWQGYLLLTGLPDDHKKRGKIIATNEVIKGRAINK